jgi:hypothetical protein
MGSVMLMLKVLYEDVLMVSTSFAVVLKIREWLYKVGYQIYPSFEHWTLCRNNLLAQTLRLLGPRCPSARKISTQCRRHAEVVPLCNICLHKDRVCTPGTFLDDVLGFRPQRQVRDDNITTTSEKLFGELKENTRATTSDERGFAREAEGHDYRIKSVRWLVLDNDCLEKLTRPHSDLATQSYIQLFYCCSSMILPRARARVNSLAVPLNWVSGGCS